MSDARLVTDRGRPAVRLERHLPDPPAVVWKALTEREQLRAWFPSDVIVSGGRWEVGAAITFTFPPEVIDLSITGEVLEVDEPHVVAFTWGEDTLRFELSPEGVLGQLGHGQAMRRRRQRHDGVAHFVEQIDRQMKSGAPLRCARARPGRPWTLLPRLPQLVGGIRTPVCVHHCRA